MIRIISIPDIATTMPPDMRDGSHGTLTVFERLLNEELAHRVVEVDADFGWPWIEFEILDATWGKVFHKLMIEPDCFELIST